MEQCRVARGGIIFAKGDAGTGLLGVLAGSVKISVASAHGRDVVLNIIHPRDIFGQREGLKHAPRLMLINDADTQARWWMRVKDEWIAAQAQGRPFVNPLEPKTLRWRS